MRINFFFKYYTYNVTVSQSDDITKNLNKVVYKCSDFGAFAPTNLQSPSWNTPPGRSNFNLSEIICE